MKRTHRPYVTDEQFQHPILAVLAQDERTVAWLARKIRYSYMHTWQATHGIVPARGEFRRRCSQVLSMSESDLFLDLPEPSLAS